MREDDLIRTLVSDLRPVPLESRVGPSLVRFVLWAALAVLVFSRGGTAISDSPHLFPVSVLLVVLGTGAGGAIVSSIPGRSSWRPALLTAGAVLAVWAGDGVLRTAASWQAPAALWGEVPWPKCFTFTLAFGVVPTFVLVRIVNRGWPVQPRPTGLLTFIAGTAAGALTIALECPSHAPLHVLLGHTLPIVMAGAIGMWAAMRLFVKPLHAPSST